MHTTISTPAGPLTIVASGDALLAAGFTAEVTELATDDPAPTGDGAGLEPIVKAVEAYFDGDLTAIDAVPVAQRGHGEFIGHAWDVLRAIPAGEPVTYTEYARRAGRPGAVRAAAQACARNGAALFVPCHRVVRTDGTLGGYRWGIHVKQWLLAHEGRVPETRS